MDAVRGLYDYLEKKGLDSTLLGETRINRTGCGGHFHYNAPFEAKTKGLTLKPFGLDDIEIKTTGLVLLPPSVHPNGYHYECFQEACVLDAPDWLADEVTVEGNTSTSNTSSSNGQEKDDYLFIPEDGGRNNFITRLKGSLAGRGLQPELVEDIAKMVNSHSHSPFEAPLPDSEIKKITTYSSGGWEGYEDYLDFYSGNGNKDGANSANSFSDGHHDSENGHQEANEKIVISPAWGYMDYKQKRAEGGFQPWEHLELEVLVKGQSIGLIGDTQSAKTWLALIWGANALRRGEVVIYFDFENGHKALYERLEILGVEDDELGNFYPFVYPSVAPQDWEKEWRYIVDHLKPSLVVDDVLLGSLDAMGLDESSNTDIQAFTDLSTGL